MKKILFILILIVPFVAMAQNDFRYDTIRVSPDDTRNIYQSQQMTFGQTATTSYANRTALHQPGDGFRFNKRNLRFGGNLGLSFSRNYSVFKLSPQVGYQFNKYVLAGVGAGYTYYKHRFWDQDERHTYRSNYMGANLFGYFYPLPFVAISARPEINYMWQSVELEHSHEKRTHNDWVPSFVVGAGMRLGRAHAMIYYDVIQNSNSPYPSTVFYGVGVYF